MHSARTTSSTDPYPPLPPLSHAHSPMFNPYNPPVLPLTTPSPRQRVFSRFINGEANTKDWAPSPTDKNAGIGMYGTCCNELDIWESNSISQQLTPHVCTVDGQHRCNGTACGDNSKGQRYDGVCDKDGCDFNPYRMGAHSFFGPSSSFTLDSTKVCEYRGQLI